MTYRATLVATASILLVCVAMVTSAHSSDIKRGVWTVIIELEYTDQSPVTRKANKAVNDMEAMIRSLGRTPNPRPPAVSKYRYRLQTCVPQNSSVGFIKTDDILRATGNWACSVSERRDGINSIDMKMLCQGQEADEMARGDLHLEFPTDQQVTGTFQSTDLGGQVVYERAIINGGRSGQASECPQESIYDVEALP